MGDFTARIDELIAMMGGGESLVGTVEVNQVYAHYQHEGLNFRHPRGGQAKFLEEPLYSETPHYLQNLADHLLRDGGVQGMIDNMEHLANEVFLKAPVEFMDLKNSGHPMVTEGSVVLYDRAPIQGRLTEEELKAKDHLRSMGLKYRNFH